MTPKTLAVAPRGLATVLATLILGLAIAASPLSQTTASAAGRAADSAGADRIGSASYPAPAGAVYVAPWGSDAHAGSAQAPLKTLVRALAIAPSTGTIVMRGGLYNESVTIDKTVTIQNAPGEEVWLDGSIPVSGWVQDGTRWRHDGWTTRFDHSPTYTKGAPDSSQTYWQFVNQSTAPMAAHPDQMWIDGAKQAQSASLAALKPGSFYLDEATSRLYLGSNPSGKQVTASNVAKALSIRASGVVIRGIGVRRYAPSVWHMGSITVEKPGTTIENVRVSEMSTTGISLLASGAQLRKVTVEWSGMLGVHSRYADGVVMTGVLVRNNNSEFFNQTPVAGGVKLSKTRGVTVINSSFPNNYGRGFWIDQSVYNATFRSSNFTGNSADGLFLEISARVVVGDSLFAHNKDDGIKVNNTSNVKIWNNTFVGNGRPIDLVQDPRRNNSSSNQDVDSRVPWPDPEMPWQLDSVTVSNNVAGLSTSAANCLMCVEDYSYQESAEAMKIRVNGNVYNRASATSPTWLAIWSRGAANPYVFTSLAAFKNTTGQEARGREYTGSAVISSAGVLQADVLGAESQIALPLPADVAGLIGRSSGEVHLGAWVDGTSTAPAPAPVAPDGGTTTGSTTIAQDNFSRSATGGWGSADTGGAWSTPWHPSQFTVSDGWGKVRLDRDEGLYARLDSAASSALDLQMSFAADTRPASGGYWVETIGRRVSGTVDYRAKVRLTADGQVTVWLVKAVDGNDTAIGQPATVPGLTWTPGKPLKLRLQVTGTSPTSVKAKVWERGLTEPTNWNISASDATAGLQQGGSIALFAYSPGSATGGPAVISFDEISAKG